MKGRRRKGIILLLPNITDFYLKDLHLTVIVSGDALQENRISFTDAVGLVFRDTKLRYSVCYF